MMSLRVIVRGAAWIAAAVLVSSCTPLTPPKVWAPDDAAVSSADHGRLVAAARRAAGEVVSFRGLFRTIVSRGAESVSYRQAVVFALPDKLRVEALPNQGALSLMLLAAHGGRVTVLEPGEKRASEGPSSTAVFRQHFNLPFREQQIMALVSGRIEPHDLDGRLETRCGALECTLARRDGRAVWRLERSSGELLSASIRDPLKGLERIVVRYQRYEGFNGVRLPSLITFTLPVDGVSVEMSRQMISVNRPIGDEIFTVAVPADYTRTPAPRSR